jgi:hypothetical protein
MTKLTKAQLVAEIEALRAQLDTQHHINRQHVADIATARALIANAQPSPNLIHAKPTYIKPAYVMPAWQVERAAQMAAAKAQAMQSGTHCKVQS